MINHISDFYCIFFADFSNSLKCTEIMPLPYLANKETTMKYSTLLKENEKKLEKKNPKNYQIIANMSINTRTGH